MSLVRRTPADLVALRRAGRVVAEMHESIRVGHPAGDDDGLAGRHRP